MRRVELAAYVLLSGAIVAGLVLAIAKGAEEVYALPGWGIAIAVVAAIVALGGMAIGWRARCGTAVALAAVAGGLAILALLSFPPLLVLVAALAAVAVGVARSSSGHGASAAAGGAMLGVGLHVVAVIALSPPLVDCEAGNAGENIFLAFGSHAATGSASSRGDTIRGRVRGDRYAFRYACRDGRLIDFELRER